MIKRGTTAQKKKKKMRWSLPTDAGRGWPRCRRLAVRSAAVCVSQAMAGFVVPSCPDRLSGGAVRHSLKKHCQVTWQ